MKMWLAILISYKEIRAHGIQFWGEFPFSFYLFINYFFKN
jgi:hypothetical protein